MINRDPIEKFRSHRHFQDDFHFPHRTFNVVWKGFWVFFPLFFIAALVFGIWAITGPCSKPISEAPAWCLSYGR